MEAAVRSFLEGCGEHGSTWVPSLGREVARFQDGCRKCAKVGPVALSLRGEEGIGEREAGMAESCGSALRAPGSFESLRLPQDDMVFASSCRACHALKADEVVDLVGSVKAGRLVLKLAVSDEQVNAAALRLCERWLEGWGSVCRERLETGDPAAVPAAEWAAQGSVKLGVGNMPDLVGVWSDVDRCIGPVSPSTASRRLLEFVYVHGFELVRGRTVYVFEDGTTAIHGIGDAVPVVPIKAADVEIARRSTYDLWRFPCAAAEQDEFKVSKRAYLEWVLSRIKANLVSALDLRRLAREMLERGQNI